MMDGSGGARELDVSTLAPILEELELDRQATKRRFVRTAWIVGAITLVLAAASFAMLNPGGLFLLMVGGVAILVARHLVAHAYRQRFKARLIAPMVAAYDPLLAYHPGRGVDAETFKASGLFRSQFNRYYREDLVEGRLGATDVQFSEVRAKFQSGGRNSSSRVVFEGVFFVAEFNKHFRGTTFVLPDTAQSLLGRFGQSLQSLESTHGELVKLEDEAFEAEFVVYASDQVEARYILSSALMQRIEFFRRRCGRRVWLSFVGSKLYLAIDADGQLFEPPLFSALTAASVEEYWSDLQLFGGIVEQLNLNTRIWTKE